MALKQARQSGEDGVAVALARLIEAHLVLPLSKVWGSGTTSSSDGPHFRVGGRGEALADINARHGNEPGVAFYTHISHQFGPFYSKYGERGPARARRPALSSDRLTYRRTLQ